VLGIGAGAALPDAPLGRVVLTPVHGTQQADHARGALGKLRRQPLPEQLLELQGQPQQDVSGFASASVPRRAENAFDLAVVDRR